MSVRKIPKNYRNVTGLAAHAKACGEAAFESTLERDFLTLLEFDPVVAGFEVQPVEVEWWDGGGRRHTYTPDVLVWYRTEMGKPPSLVEVKYRSELRQDWKKLRPKFGAAIRESRQKGWRFKLMTEVEVRTPLLVNARFLLPFVHQTQADHSKSEKIVEVLNGMGICTVQALLDHMTPDAWEQAAILPTIWYMVATRHIGCNLMEKLTMESSIW